MRKSVLAFTSCYKRCFYILLHVAILLLSFQFLCYKKSIKASFQSEPACFISKSFFSNQSGPFSAFNEVAPSGDDPNYQTVNLSLFLIIHISHGFSLPFQPLKRHIQSQNYFWEKVSFFPFTTSSMKVPRSFVCLFCFIFLSFFTQSLYQ